LPHDAVDREWRDAMVAFSAKPNRLERRDHGSNGAVDEMKIGLPSVAAAINRWTLERILKCDQICQ
jgi:hypothetical protein